MTLKMLAIGILALLGLSSVMNPKAFRVFLGGFGALCLALFLGFLATTEAKPDADDANPLTKLATKALTALGRQPSWQELAKVASDDILKLEKSGTADLEAISKEVQQDEAKKLRTYKFQPRAHITEQVRKMDVQEEIRAIFDKRLEEYKSANPGEPGVNLLERRYLDPRLLKAIRMQKGRDGQPEYILGFIESEFDRHARLVGRRLLTKDRLRSSLIYASAIGAFLFLAYGLLKVVNARHQDSRSTDYLTASDVSMV